MRPPSFSLSELFPEIVITRINAFLSPLFVAMLRFDFDEAHTFIYRHFFTNTGATSWANARDKKAEIANCIQTSDKF